MSAAQKLKRGLPAGLRRRLGALRRRLRAMPVRTHVQKQELLEDPALGGRERELLRAVEARVFFNDGMYAGDGAHYFRVGLDALRLVEGALASSGLKEVRCVLDLPCGGAYLRPEHAIDAVDVVGFELIAPVNHLDYLGTGESKPRVG